MIARYIVIFCCLAASVSMAQPAYKISFKIDGLKDTTAYLAHYFSESTYIRDTARVNGKGEVTFDGKTALGHGVYLFVVNKSKMFDFVVSNDQEFTLTTNTTDYVKNMKVEGDLDNKLFFENVIFNMARHKEAEPFIKVFDDSLATEDSKKKAGEEYRKVTEKVTQFQDDLIAKHPTTMTARMLKAFRPVRVPEPPKRADGSIDSTFQLKWYREHFFDNFDLADEALIRLPQPVYRQKINEYLDKLFVPQADSLIKAVDWIAKKAKKNQETYKYAIWLCTGKYERHEIMGLDKVFVHIVDQYFNKGELNYWANESMRKNLKDAANKMRVSLVGNIGDNLIMQDINKQPRSMYDIKNKYTLLFIFDPDCGHCREETPRLTKWYDKKAFDLEVYAVALDTSMQKMKDYIKEFNTKWITVNGPRSYVGPVQDHYECQTTPALYILDNRKKIIAKKLPVDRIEEFLKQHERMEKAKAGRKL